LYVAGHSIVVRRRILLLNSPLVLQAPHLLSERGGHSLIVFTNGKKTNVLDRCIETKRAREEELK
jgi:hypothetical protein